MPLHRKKSTLIIEHATLTIRPDGHEAFLAAFPQVQAHLLASKGCRSVDLHPSVDREAVYLLRVTWDTLEDHTEVFPASEHGRAVLAELQNHAQALDIIHFDGMPASTSA
ncbi:antibiotic biosynthesis monooxygenase family protein [Arthrobacter sp. PL16]|uniref:antibiotic biosynthesis monooxygenase family protein n=1 Tax=Arthrobacter sp. PL16 TaxID=3071720 RepID=UPI002E0FC7F3